MLNAEVILSNAVNNKGEEESGASHGPVFNTEILHTLKALLPPNGDRSGREDEKGMHYVCLACVNIQKANMPFVSLHTHTQTYKLTALSNC